MRHLVAALAFALAASPALAESYWDELARGLWPDRALHDGAEVVAIDAPYRTDNDARTRIAARVAAPGGRHIAAVTLVIDENPMPVSAVFTLDTPQPRFFFDVTMRVNGPTPVHVVAETTDGTLYVAETFVKTSGQGACAAPPGTDPAAALATLGDMTIGLSPLSGDPLALADARLDVDLSHPSHSGLQMDQISLLFIPMRYVERLEVDIDGAGFVDMTGSISLSENPSVSLGVPAGTRSAGVTMTDTDGTVSRAEAEFPGY